MARAERAVLVRRSSDAGGAPAGEVYALLAALYGRWRVELAARDEAERSCGVADLGVGD